MAKHEKLSIEEEGQIVAGLGKSLPMKDACAYAGVVWERLESLLLKDEELKLRLWQVVAQEQGRVLDLMKAKGNDVKALAFLLERVYGLSTVETKDIRKEKEKGNTAITITPAVLKALAFGSERLIKRN